MSFFRWAAPLFNRFGDRWGAEDVAAIADRLRPHAPPGSKLMDLGGGTGALAVKVAHLLDAEATVLDPTQEMLRYVPNDPDVLAVRGSAEAMPFPNDSFDAVIVSDAFHHFADQAAAAREMQRVTRCGGAILVLELDPRPWYMRMVVRMERWLGEPGTFFSPEGLCEFFSGHGIRGECRRESAISYSFLGVVEAPAVGAGSR